MLKLTKDDMPRAWNAVFFLTAAALTGAPAMGAPQDWYQISVSDRLDIRVIEWRAAEVAFKEWTELGGEYVVGPEGTISFPFMGAVSAAGHSLTDIERFVGEGLTEVLGLSTPPDVTVEVVSFAPIFVTGDVSSPGQHAFMPGLNVVKAISLAGGHRGARDAGGRAEREVISAQGTLDVLISNYDRLLVRQARLQAELADETVVPVPGELTDSAQEALVASQQAILDANILRKELNLETLQSQRELLTREIGTLEQKRTNAARQLASAQEQLVAISALADQGLAISSRVSALEGSVAGFEGHLLDIDNAELRARQELANIEQREIEFGSSRISTLTVELQQVEREIAELALRIQTQRALVREAISLGGAGPTTSSSLTFSITIVRGDAEIEADNTTPVLPGDVIVVTMAL